MARYKRDNKKVITIDWGITLKRIVVVIKKFFSPLIRLYCKISSNFCVAKVFGVSMYPQFLDSEPVLVEKGSDTIGIGDVVLFKHPYADYPLVKRVINVYDDNFFVQGDDTITSIDSRHFGLISKENIIGRVIL